MSLPFFTTSKLHLVIAALMGLAGTVLLAMSAHGGGASLQTAGHFLLFHAPVIIAVTAIRRLELMPMRWGANSITVLILGVTLFSGDLALRSFKGIGLFPNAAPIGGGLIMLGWVTLAVCALMSKIGRSN
jgi:uncharacterized membrane protein YgdD (TMEM256/DUF423 family)